MNRRSLPLYQRHLQLLCSFFRLSVAASLQVHMMFLPGENFVVNPPAADVCSLDGRLQILGLLRKMAVLRRSEVGNPVFPDASNRN